VRALGITGDIRHGSGMVEATLAVGTVTVGTDGVTPMDAVATFVVIMDGAMLARIADSTAGRLSVEARTTAVAASTVGVATVADAGNQQNDL